MTSEVVLMNRRGVALAADSASTITRWVRGQEKRRYFKGTNKLFQLSTRQPVGIMINGAGSMQGVPWEALLKTFREHLGNKTFECIGDFAKELFNWLENNRDAFPEDFLRDQFLSEVVETAGRVCLPAIRALRDEKDKSKKEKALSDKFAETKKRVERAAFIGNATKDDFERIIKVLGDDARKAVTNHPFLGSLAQTIGASEIAEAAILGVYKHNFSTLDETGIVVAGYGTRDYFPSVEAHNCFGMAVDKLIVDRDDGDCRRIDQSNTSELLPFAKSDMIYTFMVGVGISGLVEIDTLNQKAMAAMVSKMKEAKLLDENADVSGLTSGVHADFKEAITEHFRANHMRSLRDVVGMLPIGELAELSETLVSIESIKERVTTDEETVSGPIDVAVITKNDGFVWIKRKHYFERDLNPRYFARLNENGDGGR